MKSSSFSKRKKAKSNFKKEKKIDAFSSKVIMVRKIGCNKEAINFSNYQLTKIIKGEFRNATETCWQEMKHLRAASYCSLCSGRADAFFVGDKILIDENACNAVISKCE